MPGIIKIGFTENSVEQRMRELDKTPTPIPFECYYAKRIDKAEFVEKKMHEAFDEFRIRDNREFFRMSPEQAKAALDIAEGEDVTPREDVVETTSDKTALDKERNRNRFNFAQIGIEVGEELEFKKDISKFSFAAQSADGLNIYYGTSGVANFISPSEKWIYNSKEFTIIFSFSTKVSFNF